MLTAFVKSEDEKSIQCEIVKFVDRMWLEENGCIRCLRTFIIHNKDVREKLKRVRMIMPINSLLKTDDFSEKFLDPNYLFAKSVFSTGGYNLINKDPINKFGKIDYDDFKNVKVYYNNIITTRQLESDSAILIEVKNELNPIEPNELRLVHIFFKTESMVKPMFGTSDIYYLKMSYFEGREIKQAVDDLIGDEDLEIPVVKIFDAETKQGGFDTFLYLPPQLQGQNFNSERITTASHQFDGTEGAERQKFIWRARYLFEI